MATDDAQARPVGVFDSGVGGLAVLAELQRLLPAEDFVYYADSAHFPYGGKATDAVRARADAVTRELLARAAKLIVVACNTATSAAIAHLRAAFADVPFVGMEPALKPAAALTKSGRVGLLVTPGTAEGEKLAGLIDRHGAGVRVDVVAAAGLADAVEHGQLDGDARALVRRYVAPLRASGADVLALGCTHYVFLRRVIEEEAGPRITVIEPSEAVARQAKRLLEECGLLNPGADAGGVTYLTSGDAAAFAEQRARLRAAGAEIPGD
jgi:glutamate racemase